MSRQAIRSAGAVALCAGLGVSVSASASAAQVTANWFAPVSGAWSDPLLWTSAPYFPNVGNPSGTTYRVVFDAAGAAHTATFDLIAAIDELVVDSADATLRLTAGQLTVHEDSVIHAGTVWVDGGSLRGAGDLLVHGDLRWSSGVLQGAGVTTVSASGRLVMDGAGAKSLTRRIDNYGEAEWSSGVFGVFSGGSLRNYGMMTIDSSAGDLTALAVMGNQGDVRNEGTLRKVGAGAATFQGGDAGVAVQNDGLIEVVEGTLRLQDAETHAGDFHVESGAALEFSYAQTFIESSAWTGPGAFVLQGEGFLVSEITHLGTVDVGTLHAIDADAEFLGAVRMSTVIMDGGSMRLLGSIEMAPGGVVDVRGGTLDLGAAEVSMGRFDLSGGLARTDGLVTFSGVSEWTGGTLGGTGAFVFDGLSEVTIVGSAPRLSADAINAGVMNHVFAGFQISTGFELVNEGVYHMNGPHALRTSGGGALVNAGEFMKSGGGVGSLSGFTNTGEVRVLGGILSLEVGGEHSGSFDVASGTELWLAGGQRTLAGSVIKGGGRVQLKSGSWISEGEVDGVGSVALLGGAASVFGAMSADELRVSNGTHAFHGALDVDSLIVTGGTSAFHSPVETESLQWSGGVIGGYVVGAGSHAALSGALSLSAGGLQNDGEVIVSGGSLNASVGGVTNRGVWTIGDGWTGTTAAGGAGFVNEGEWVKEGPGLSQFGAQNGARFVNSGEVDVRAGVLRFATGIDSDGVIHVAQGASVELTGASRFGDGAVVDGAGTLVISGQSHEFAAGAQHFSTLSISNGATVFGAGELNVGRLVWAGGSMVGAGRTVIIEGGTLTGSGSASLTRGLARTLENRGESTLESIQITMDGGVIENVGTLTMSNGASWVGAGAGGSVVNTGLIRVAGPGASTLSGPLVSLTNLGVIEIGAGAALLTDSQIADVGAVVGAGTLQLISGDGVVASGGSIDVGRIVVAGGSHIFEATTYSDAWSFTGGEAVFLAPFVDAAEISVTGTALDLALGATFAPGGAILVSGTGSVSVGTETEVPLLVFVGGAIRGDADLIVTDSMSWAKGVMEGDGRTIIEAGASAGIQGFTPLTLRRELINRGELAILGAPVRMEGGALWNEGVITVEAFQGAPITLSGESGAGGRLINEGTLVKDGAGDFRVLSNGGVMTFENSGLVEVRDGAIQIDGASPVTNEGRYAFAHRGQMEVFAAFENSADAELSFEVGGIKERGLSGLMTITGEASLAGTLSVETPDVFEATWGDRWVVMSYASVDGDFDVFDLPTQGFASRSDDFGASDLRWYAERGETEYAVGVSHIADIDHDGLIGFADLNVVASNFNTFGSWAQGDVDGDGFVGFTDLNVVLSLFNVAAPRSVPGPGTAALLVVGGVAVGRRRRGV